MNINSTDTDNRISRNEYYYDNLYSEVYMSWNVAYEEGNDHDRRELLQQMVTYVQTTPQQYDLFWYSLKTIAHNAIIDLCNINISAIEKTIHDVYERMCTTLGINDIDKSKDATYSNLSNDFNSCNHTLLIKLETIFETLGGNPAYYLDFDIVQKLQPH